MHDATIHFCVGMDMFNGGVKKAHIMIYFTILGLITPVGVTIGILVTEGAGGSENVTQTLIVGLLQGLSGGTLLYIAFYEVLDREKLAKAGMTGIIGCALLIFGFSVMAALEAAGGHSHGVAESNDSTEKYNSVESLWNMNNLNGVTQEDPHEHAMADLGNAISKYDLHVHIHNAKDHHKEHRDPDHGGSEQSDLKNEAQKINIGLVPHKNKKGGHGHGHSHGHETETDPTKVFDFEEIF